ncbi:MBL fold metallo-hydrolase [Flexithrix dorotheae]|uniref:MBL fold metallo-hydrolase n=1 Tax=Flexithrix dorotheae TaxID=70993 RepID=UPI00036159B3|nr:MBL fold metallo-hydrolase [Flexithrix dorotheae]
MAPKIKVKFYGTRGSIPICDPDFFEFGGNTTCISIFNEDNNHLTILDAGTGIRKLGKEILSDGFSNLKKEVSLIFTHFHWDHIQGFPFFDPAYEKDWELRIMALGKGQEISDLKELFSTQMQSEYFPIALDDMGAKMDFILSETEREVFPTAKISIQKHKHPGGAFSYRGDWKGKSLVICTDIEHGDELDPNIVAFAKDADLLIHEAQYTSEELLRHKDWGHSSFEQAIEVAEKANCKKLVMTHHDPDHNDAFLREIEKKCQQRFKNCFLAREGMEFEV